MERGPIAPLFYGEKCDTLEINVGVRARFGPRYTAFFIRFMFYAFFSPPFLSPFYTPFRVSFFFQPFIFFLGFQ